MHGELLLAVEDLLVGDSLGEVAMMSLRNMMAQIDGISVDEVLARSISHPLGEEEPLPPARNPQP